MNPSISQQVRAMAAEIFEISPQQAGDDASPQTVEKWDSMQHLNFVLGLESRFGVQFEPEEIEGIGSIGAAIQLVEKKTQAGRPG